MCGKLTWQEIKKRYYGEWVELINFKWDMRKPDPEFGVVRVHSKDKKEFKELIMKDCPEESALIYVGDKLLPHKEGRVFSANIHQYLK